MTAKERTQLLLLDIALTRDARFTSLQFQQLCEASGVLLSRDAIESTLCALVNLGALSFSATDDIRYDITAEGVDLKDRLRRAELEEIEVGPLAFHDSGVSEEAVDGWWETSDYEIKATAFKRFYEPYKAEA